MKIYYEMQEWQNICSRTEIQSRTEMTAPLRFFGLEIWKRNGAA